MNPECDMFDKGVCLFTGEECDKYPNCGIPKIDRIRSRVNNTRKRHNIKAEPQENKADTPAKPVEPN